MVHPLNARPSLKLAGNFTSSLAQVAAAMSVNFLLNFSIAAEEFHSSEAQALTFFQRGGGAKKFV